MNLANARLIRRHIYKQKKESVPGFPSEDRARTELGRALTSPSVASITVEYSNGETEVYTTV